MDCLIPRHNNNLLLLLRFIDYIVRVWIGCPYGPAWDSFKKDLAGSMDNFAKMEEAAGTQGKYYVHDA